MSNSLPIARWSLNDYHRMIEAGLLEDRSIELLNGFMVEMAPEGPEHADCSTRLMPQLWSAANGRYQVRAAKPISIPTSESEPEPDIALVRDQSYRQSHPNPEDIFLVIEFSHSSLTKDTEDKRWVYAQAGIPEYWVVNLRDHQVLVYQTPVDGDYRSQQKFLSGFLSLLAFPDVALDVSELLD